MGNKKLWAISGWVQDRCNNQIPDSFMSSYSISRYVDGLDNETPSIIPVMNATNNIIMTNSKLNVISPMLDPYRKGYIFRKRLLLL